MNGAMIDSIFNTFFKLKISHSYDALLPTPLDVTDIALGEVCGRWRAPPCTRRRSSSAWRRWATPGAPWVILCWPGAILTSLTFSCMGLAACTYMRTWQDFDLVTLVQLPLFLFSGTFFPITLYPHWLGAIVSVSPLYQSAALLRGFSLGQFDWIMIFRAAYLLAIALVSLYVTARRFQRDPRAVTTRLAIVRPWPTSTSSNTASTSAT